MKMIDLFISEKGSLNLCLGLSGQLEVRSNLMFSHLSRQYDTSPLILLANLAS